MAGNKLMSGSTVSARCYVWPPLMSHLHGMLTSHSCPSYLIPILFMSPSHSVPLLPEVMPTQCPLPSSTHSSALCAPSTSDATSDTKSSKSPSSSGLASCSATHMCSILCLHTHTHTHTHTQTFTPVKTLMLIFPASHST